MRRAQKGTVGLQRRRVWSMRESPPTSKVGKGPDPDIQAPGTGPENAIAPEGTRNL